MSAREQALRVKASLDMYADLAGKPRMDMKIAPAPKPRAAPKPSGVPLEAEVQASMIEGLRYHPMVGLVERVNSGAAMEYAADGSKRIIQFVVIYAHGLASPDVHCTLKPSGRRFVIEVKRLGWKGPRDQRELRQEAYIDRVRACGGYGIFATSWDDVAAELKRIERAERGRT